MLTIKNTRYPKKWSLLFSVPSNSGYVIVPPPESFSLHIEAGDSSYSSAISFSPTNHKYSGYFTFPSPACYLDIIYSGEKSKEHLDLIKKRLKDDSQSEWVNSGLAYFRKTIILSETDGSIWYDSHLKVKSSDKMSEYRSIAVFLIKDNIVELKVTSDADPGIAAIDWLNSILSSWRSAILAANKE